jgi:hypothetical protein
MACKFSPKSSQDRECIGRIKRMASGKDMKKELIKWN